MHLVRDSCGEEAGAGVWGGSDLALSDGFHKALGVCPPVLNPPWPVLVPRSSSWSRAWPGQVWLGQQTQEVTEIGQEQLGCAHGWLLRVLGGSSRRNASWSLTCLYPVQVPGTADPASLSFDQCST